MAGAVVRRRTVALPGRGQRLAASLTLFGLWDRLRSRFAADPNRSPSRRDLTICIAPSPTLSRTPSGSARIADAADLPAIGTDIGQHLCSASRALDWPRLILISPIG